MFRIWPRLSSLSIAFILAAPLAPPGCSFHESEIPRHLEVWNRIDAPLDAVLVTPGAVTEELVIPPCESLIRDWVVINHVEFDNVEGQHLVAGPVPPGEPLIVVVTRDSMSVLEESPEDLPACA